MRVQQTSNPYPALADMDWNRRSVWPCKWVVYPDLGEPPFVTAYRCLFTLAQATTMRVHVTADERYELYVDGRRVGRGSERGDGDNWFFETYDIALEPGDHVIVARVWSLGEQAPFAQMSVYPGFILSPQEQEHIELIGTGVALWEAKKLHGYEFINPMAAWGTGANIIIHGEKFDWGFERGLGEGWETVKELDAGADPLYSNDYAPMHLLKPAPLPPMLEADRHVGTIHLVSDIPALETHSIPIQSTDNIREEAETWSRLIHGEGSVTIPSHTRRRVLIDLDDYYCAYPEIITAGGANSLIRVNWQESLFNEPDAKTKGNRDEVEGKYFITIWWLKDGIGDTFKPHGGEHRLFETLWWQCGRFVEVVVEAAAEPLTIESFKIRETRYPLEMEADFTANDQRLLDVIPLAVRVLQMCSHETYMDCPYYEQLMYVGDTRLQVLTTYAITHDDRLPRKAIQMFDASRLHSGLTQSRYPTRVRQTTRSFALWWVAMIHDFALWRGDKEFVLDRIVGVRGVFDAFQRFLNADGLLELPPGPNFPFLD